MTARAHVVSFDPLRDKSYRRAKLGRDVVAWLDFMELGEASPRTLEQYEHDLSRLCKLFPHKAIDEITDADLLALARRFKVPERRVRMAAVRSFFKWAKQTRRITDNPVDYLPAIKRKAPRVPEVFSDGEVEKLLSLDVVDSAPLAVLFDAGLRKAEARALTFRHCRLELEEERSVVVVMNGKGGRDRVVPMPKRLRGLLADLATLEDLRPEDHIFYAKRANEVSSKRIRRTPIGEGTFHRWWGDCLERAGVRYRVPHTARHTYATTWRQRGLRVEELAANLGHASTATTMSTYVHTNAGEIAAHMALIEAEV